MRRTFFLFVIAAALAAPSIGYAQTEPNLTGEIFTEGASPPTLFEAVCDADGTSEFTYTFSNAVALGPFPGVLTETAHVEIGPLAGPSPEIPFGFSAGTVVEVNATYKVEGLPEGPLGDVNGIKFLQAVVPENLGTCAQVPMLTVPGVMDLICTQATYVQAHADRLAYFAKIVTAEGTFDDEGDSALEMSALECATIGQQGSLDETFVSTRMVTTPGQATGGGMVDFQPGAPGVTFSFTADSDDTGRLTGRCSVISHQTVGAPVRETQVACLDVTSYSQFLNHAIFSGNAEVNGAPTMYRIDVIDGGDGGPDTFLIETDTGFTAGGEVTQGEVTVH